MKLRFALAAALALPFAAQAASPPPIVIGTGPIASFAFPLGGEVCRLYELTKEDKTRCAVAATEGSVEDLNRLRDGEIEFALVQSDRIADALSASGPFTGKPPFTDLRSLVGFYGETLTLIVRSDGPVRIVDDLKGQRIIVGEPGIPDTLLFDFVEGMAWSKADLGGTVEMARGQQIAALCAGKAAAIAVTAPHPNGFVREALATCPTKLLDLTGAGLDAAVAANTAYAPYVIAAGTYAGMTQPVQSLGPRTVLVSSAKTPDAHVSRFLAAMFNHLTELRKAHPAFAGLGRDTLASGVGLSANRHPAALKYLTDNKLLDGGGE